MRIGILADTRPGEIRVVATPEAVASMKQAEVDAYQPRIVFVDENNQITGLKKQTQG